MESSNRRRREKKPDVGGILRKSWYRLRVSVRDPCRVATWDAVVLTAASPEQAELYTWQLLRAKRTARIAPGTVTIVVPDPDGHRIGSGAATLNALFALANHYLSVDRGSVTCAKLGENAVKLSGNTVKSWQYSSRTGSCHEIAVPDLDGERIGVYSQDFFALAKHYLSVVQGQVTNGNKSEFGSSIPCEISTDEVLSMFSLIAKKHILLLHAGGDSKRVPWANPMGKVFLPLPYLASDDPDGPVPLLFDHILAISSCARQAFGNEGGLFIMTGDVLPCFDASTMVLPEDSSCIITVPITLDIAANHGVIVASKTGTSDGTRALSLVDDLLQKPSVDELVKHKAILNDGRALLDTGIIAVRGKAWEDLALLSCSCPPLISKVLKDKKEMSLYEDLVAAWVPAKHEWLLRRPLGEELVKGLGQQKMFSYCAYDFSFLHFGTSSEILDHLSGDTSGLVGHRHLCSIPATTVSDIAASAVILSSKISPSVSIGEDSLIYDSSISSGVQIGSLSIVVGVSMPLINDCKPEDSFRFMLPDRHCLWEVPLVGFSGRVIVYCGVHDNPKNSMESDGTFCGKPWEKFLSDLGLKESDLWSSMGTNNKCLWNAKIYPIATYGEMLSLASWLMGLNEKNESLLDLWKNSRRVSLEELHRSINFPQMCLSSGNHQADLAAGIVKACLNFGLLGRNLSQLCEEVLQKEATGVEICKDFLAMCPNIQVQNSKILPKSRIYQVEVDFLRACGDETNACKLEHKVWDAVADETASAVRYGFKEHLLESSHITSPKANQGPDLNASVDRSPCYRTVKVELPVRVDFVGGWSDTPPWSLERAGCVLNMAISLEGSLPIGTIIETTNTTGVLISDDAKNELYIEELSTISSPFKTNDPFRLVKSAMLVTGIVHNNIFLSTGLRIKTWANVPRGSGLGTSSILAAAVVKGLLQITDGDQSSENVARLVLVLEQLMGTGGGWQDQIGGLYPGIKFTSSFPGIPLRLQVVPLLASSALARELKLRLLVVFTGQVRLAHQVLQKVVIRYLRRDNLLVSSIKRLAELAKIGREALMNCDIDQLGEIMLEAWRLHQELDPYCSNDFIDKLFSFADPYCCGYKLVGAGGGGFALLLAKNAESAKELSYLLDQASDFNVKVYNWDISF